MYRLMTDGVLQWSPWVLLLDEADWRPWNTVIRPNANRRMVCVSKQTRSSLPVIAIYIVTKNMTLEQHTKGRDRLHEVGAPESAMKLHSCFGEDGHLQVFDVW